MKYRLFFVLLLTFLTACSLESRQMWGHALMGAADRMGSTQTVYCRTQRVGHSVVTNCY